MPHIHDLYDFTVSAYILHPTEPKICLHEHRKLGMWLQPGGHIELDEDPIQALTHELLEETGLSEVDFEILEVFTQPHPRGYKTIPIPFNINVHSIDETHKHIDFSYLVKSKIERLNPAQGESNKIGWFNIQDITNFLEQGKLQAGTLDLCEWALKYQSSV